MLSDRRSRIAPLSVSDNNSWAFFPTQSQPTLPVISLSGWSPRTEFITARVKRTSAMPEHLSDELTPPSQSLQRSFWQSPLDLTAIFSIVACAEGAPVCPVYLFPRPSLKFSKAWQAPTKEPPASVLRAVLYNHNYTTFHEWNNSPKGSC